MITYDNLACRHFASEHIRTYALLLARHGYHEMLTSLEPLHRITEDSPDGVLLWATYNVACGLPDVAEWAMVLARRKWPEDKRLSGMLQ